MALQVRPFPWHALPRIARGAWLEELDLRERLRAALAPAQAAAVLGMLLGATVSAELVSCRARPRAELPARPNGIVLGFPGTGLRVTLHPEPELARLCVARLLKQDFELGWPDTELDPALRGASAALALEVARRTARREAPDLNGASEPQGSLALELELSLRVDQRAYRIGCECERVASPARGFEPSAPFELERLGSLPLAVPWVAAVFALTPQSIAAAEVGDVWLPAGGWLAPHPHTQSGVLAPPKSAFGLGVDASRGKFVLGAVMVHLDREEPQHMSQEPNAHLAPSEPSALEEIVGDTPLLVRLEIGSLELTAREWAALTPGDVLQSGRRLDAPVVLRVLGQELAHGELVEIDGEIGVRITRLVPHRGVEAAANGADVHARGEPRER